MVDADKVRLVEIDDHNVRQVFDLEVAPGQERFVAANAWSLRRPWRSLRSRGRGRSWPATRSWAS